MTVLYAKDETKQQYVFRSTLQFSAEQHLDSALADTSSFDYKQMAAMEVAKHILNNPKLKIRGIGVVYEMKNLINSHKKDINSLNPSLYDVFNKLENCVDNIIQAQEIEVENVELKWSEELSRKLNYERY